MLVGLRRERADRKGHPNGAHVASPFSQDYGGEAMAKRSTSEIIEDFLSDGPWAVVGASTSREKYGNKVLRAYIQSGRAAWPINPRTEKVEGFTSYPDLSSLPDVPRGVSIITPPEITEAVVEEAARLGVKFVWMQPGAESPRALEIAAEKGLEAIGDGSCLLVVTGFRED
jgi:predicted CoA-binding protein